MSSTFFKRRRRIFDKQRDNPQRREYLLELADAGDAFRRATEELRLAQQKPFDESYTLRTLPPTVIPSALRERARVRINTIAARMMKR